MKIIFFHNTITHYRAPLFSYLHNNSNIEFVFTKINDYKKIYDLNFGSEKFDFNYKAINRISDIIKILKGKDFDIVVLPPIDYIKDFFYAMTINMCLFFRPNIRKVYFSERWVSEKRPLKKKITDLLKDISIKICTAKVDRFIVSGSKAREYLNRILKVNNNKIITSPDCSLIETLSQVKIRDSYNISTNSKILLYFGRIIERKGILNIIKAFEKIERNFDDIILLICGDGNKKSEYEKFVSENNISNVIFTGSVSPDLRYDYFKEAYIFMYPSYYYNGDIEAWGLSVNEAMQIGVPVITTDAVGSAYDLILNKETGYMVKENDVNAIYNALKDILNNPQKRDLFGKNAKALIDSCFTYEISGRVFVNTFKKLIGHDEISKI